MMCLARSRAGLCLLALAPLLLTSCNPFGHVRPPKPGSHPNLPKLEASKAQLIESLSTLYQSIQSFSLECRMVVSTGSVYKGPITDYSETQGAIDFRKPGDIKVVGMLPIVGGVGLYMVSDGKTFKVSIPPKSRFYEGSNDAPANSPNKFENIRPEMFLSALLVKPVDKTDEKTIKADDIGEEYAYYQLAVVKVLPDGDLQLERRITFDRINLYAIEEREYAPDGTIVSLSRYGDWKVYNGIRFPNHIDIMRPKEEISIELNVTKMDMNVPVPDAKFVLTKPDGYELKTIGKPNGVSYTDQPKGRK